MGECIFLIGFRAVGKTTIGHNLSRRLGFSFVDTDELICAKKGQPVDVIVQAEGWDGFRRCEQEVLRQLRDYTRCVIATGGGAILHRHLWPSLKEQGLVVWLTASPDVVCRRIQQDCKTAGQRPSLTGADVCAEVREVLAIREPMYRETADLVVDTEKLTVSEVVDVIVDALQRGMGNDK